MYNWPERCGNHVEAGAFPGSAAVRRGPGVVSGIYGLVRYHGAPVDREAQAPMAAAMSFYGPDGHGQWCGDSAALGHLMLHTTPESLHERLPANIQVAPHLMITADARIDNRDELFDALGVPGPERRETPDSSLILLAYERWGADCVKRFLGDFAFAIWDTLARKLFCARDPFGCRPLVYHHGGKRLIFASDIRAVLAGLESPKLNDPLLAAYLRMNTCFAEKRLTFFREIVKLQPGHTLTLTAGGLEISRYWSPEEAPEVRLATAAEYAEQLGILFRQSVECRLRSAFPIGSHLSGGMDSSAVTVAAARILRERGRELAVFSWSPPPGSGARPHPEGEYARIDAVCRQERLSCEYIAATKASLIETFGRDITVEPMVMMAREGNVQARAQTRQVRVMLSGWGGDEAVTCRATTSPAEFGRWADFRNAIGSRVGAPTIGMADREPSPWLKARRLRIILRDLVAVRLPDSLYRRVVADPFMMLGNSCIRPAFASLYRREVNELQIPALRHLPGVRESICRLLEIGNVPLRMDHWAASGARRGLVYRYPMLDKRLVEFALGIPPSPFRDRDQRRSLFRQAVGELLPTCVDWREAKREDATQMAMTGEFIRAHSEWADHLASDMVVSPANRFVDPDKVRRAVQSAVKSGKREDLAGVREAFGCYAIRY